MSEYHKIPTVWKRDPETKFKTLIPGAWATPELEVLRDIHWIAEEKVDGTNIRVIWDGHRVSFAGRTDRAQIPSHLMTELQAAFPEGAMEEQFRDSPTVLYGEGYGAKIQKGGGDYNPDGCAFILFDVRVGEWWLRREDVGAVAEGLSISTVPVPYPCLTLSQAVEECRKGFPSAMRGTPPEGLVLRPAVDLFDRRGNRIIAKVKIKDFPR